MSDRPVHAIQFRDGLVIPQEEPPLLLNTSISVFLDDEIRPIGAAFARLIATRDRLHAELESARTELADLKAQRTQEG